MKVAVIAANGRSGQLIVKEALERGFDVTAFVRGKNESAAKQAVVKDIFEITKEDLAGFDAVVNAFGAWTEETFPLHEKLAIILSDAVSGTNTRLLFVGGAGSLYLDKEHTLTLAEAPDFPAEYKGVADATAKALDVLRKRDDVKWTYISPAADFQAEGARTGEYILAGEEFTLNERGESVISYADFAVAMVDEIEKGNHIQERISVVGK